MVARTNVDGGPGSGPGSAEAALDIEDIIGLAPDAGLGLAADASLGLPANTGVQVYQGPTNANGTNVIDVYNRIAIDDSTQVVSTSWGSCEANSNTSFTNGERAIFQMMAAQGQTIFAASGDAGSADCDTNPAPNTPPNTSAALAVDDPASQPEVTGVGGTSLASTTGPETVWNDGLQPNGIGGVTISAGGGGVSSKWQMPSWQSAPGVVSAQSSGTPCGAPGATLCREVPDVSASADPAHGYQIFYSGSWFAVGGTSASAPLWAAFMALVDGHCGQRVGFLNPTLYQLRTAGTTDFHDVSSGNNDGVGGARGAVRGYDRLRHGQRSRHAGREHLALRAVPHASCRRQRHDDCGTGQRRRRHAQHAGLHLPAANGERLHRRRPQDRRASGVVGTVDHAGHSGLRHLVSRRCFDLEWLDHCLRGVVLREWRSRHYLRRYVGRRPRGNRTRNRADVDIHLLATGLWFRHVDRAGVITASGRRHRRRWHRHIGGLAYDSDR